MRVLLGTLMIVFLAVVGVGLTLDWADLMARRDEAGKVTGVALNINRDRFEQDVRRAREAVQSPGTRPAEGTGGEERPEPATNVALTAEGTVTALDESASRLTVQTDDRELPVTTTRASTIRRHEVEVPLGQLMEGDRVAVRYRERDGQNVAESVTVLPRP